LASKSSNGFISKKIDWANIGDCDFGGSQMKLERLIQVKENLQATHNLYIRETKPCI
jgi:hypothetical protein